MKRIVLLFLIWSLVGTAIAQLAKRYFYEDEIFFTGTGSLNLHNGTTGERPGAPSTGALRFNSTISKFEGYNGSLWGAIGGSSLTTKGDIQGFDTDDARIPVGNDGEFLVADSDETLGVKYTSSLSGAFNPVTDWESFTPTGSWSTNTTYTGRKRRVGDSEEYEVVIALSGAPDSVNLTLDTDNPVDYTKITSSSTTNLGFVWLYDTNIAANRVSGVVTANTSGDSVRFFATGDTLVSDVVPFTWASGDSVRINFKVPIVGWSSGLDAVVEKKQLLKVIANTLSGGTSTTSFAYNYVDTLTETVDTHNALDDTGDIVFTVPHDGYFDFDFGSLFTYGSSVTSSECGLEIVSSSSSSKSYTPTFSSVTHYTKCEFLGLKLDEGDTVKFFNRKGGTASITWNTDARFNYLIIQEQPESAVITGVSEKCQVKYLSADVTSDTVGISDLEFTNLDIGKTYEVCSEMRAIFPTAADNISLVTIHDSVNLVDNVVSSATNLVKKGYACQKFTATATTVTHNGGSITAGNSIEGDSTVSQTHVELCETSVATTTEW